MWYSKRTFGQQEVATYVSSMTRANPLGVDGIAPFRVEQSSSMNGVKLTCRLTEARFSSRDETNGQEL